MPERVDILKQELICGTDKHTQHVRKRDAVLGVCDEELGGDSVSDGEVARSYCSSFCIIRLESAACGHRCIGSSLTGSVFLQLLPNLREHKSIRGLIQHLDRAWDGNLDGNLAYAEVRVYESISPCW